jgi:hypothetical protein
MTADELERAIARISRMTASARERLAALSSEVEQVRMMMSELAAAGGGGEPDPQTDRAARKGTSGPEAAQAEALFK